MSKKLSYVFENETCLIVWTLNCKMEDLGELKSLVASTITCPSDCEILIS